MPSPEFTPRHLHDLPAMGLPPLALAVGVFDGVHRGHQALLAAAQEEAASQADALTAALTFDPHPSAIFSPSRVPPLLGTLDERAGLLHRYGASEVVIARFDRALAALTPDEFIHDVLRERLRVRAVVVGEDFRFGCDRAGDVSYLRAAGEREGFAVRVMPPVFVRGIPARSTAIRHMVAGGQVGEAARLLGRPYALSGTVAHGRKQGRTLGFPTANLRAAPEVLVPGDGVYAGVARLPATGEAFRAAVSVGTNPTVTPGAKAPRTIEAYLMDGFDRDIYGQPLAVEFHHFLRGTEKFADLDALIARMHRDVAEAARLVPLP